MNKIVVPALTAALLATAAPTVHAQTASSDTISMQTAIEAAVRSRPDILQAQYNKEGIQFERKQAQGLYGPRVDVEASAGVRR